MLRIHLGNQLNAQQGGVRGILKSTSGKSKVRLASQDANEVMYRNLSEGE